jgi:TRAP-type C4-dicarboxylate transport system permease small subunit
MKRFLDGLAKVVEKTVGFILIAVFIMLVAEIFSRYLFHYSFRWVFELTRYLIIWIVFLGTSIGIRRAQLTSITFVTETLSPRAAKIVTILGILFMAGFLFLCVYYGYEALGMVANQSSPAMGINMSIPYLVVPIGSTMILIFLLEGLTRLKKEEKK